MAGWNSNFEVGDMLVQFGCTNKDQAECRLDLPRRFNSRPVVLVSPYWVGAGSNVGNAETVDTISDDRFTLYSGNAASNYNVNWIALGERDGTPIRNSRQLAAGDLLLQFDRYNKRQGATHNFSYETAYPQPPGVQISPQWDGVHSAVGHAETLLSANREDVAITSNHADSNYFVHWLAAGRSGGPLGNGTYEIGGRYLIQWGFTAKAKATQDVRFLRPFGSLPSVLVTPQWTTGVGRPETIQRVTTSSFSLISGNAGSGYRVSWFAIGLAP